MSEIEKMYENAGIEPTITDACSVEDKYWQNEKLANEYGTFDMYMNAKCGQQEDCSTLCSCAYTKEEYPDFTAEKQLELIKWLAKNKEDCKVTYDSNYSWATQTYWESSFCYEKFEESLANLINIIWQDLTESEKEEIRGILNG